MALSESQRQTYLETMDIQSYFPRYNLPAAKASVQCEWPEALTSLPLSEKAAEVSELQTPLAEAPVAEVLKESEVKSIVIDDAPKDVQPEAKVDVETLGENHEASLDEVRFQLAFIRVNDSLCILNQIPHIRRGNAQLSSAHKSLLLSLLRSVQVNAENIQFDDLAFCWPISEGEHIDKSEKAAKETLNSYLEQKQSDEAFKCLLVMGELASNYTMSKQAPWQVISTRSLDEMLTMPLVKRDVWQHIQGLTGLHAGI